MPEVKVALIQFSTEGLETSESIKEKGLNLIKKALEEEPDFIVLPEIFTTKYFPQYKNDSSFQLAEEIPGPTINEIYNLIKGSGTTVVASIYERDGDNYFCSAGIVNGNEGYIGKYRKLHIPTPPGIYEDYFFAKGNLGHVVFEVNGIKFAVMLCYDRHFPESARIYGLNDVDILFVCSATPVGARNVWQQELCTHSYMNGYFVACANRTGTEDKIQFLGSSLISSYKGELIIKAEENEEKIITAELNIDEARVYRRNLSFYRDRRPELYREISE